MVSSKTGRQPFSDTSAYKVSEYSLVNNHCKFALTGSDKFVKYRKAQKWLPITTFTT